MTREEFLRRKMMFERGIFHEDPPKTEPTKPIKHTSMADNELLNFQERVRMGKKYYADQMTEYFDVNAANEDNFRRMVENHAIIHGSADPNNAVLAREVSKNAEQEYKDFKQKVKEGQQYVVNQKEEYIDINAINADNQRQMAEDRLIIHSELAQKFAKKAVDIGNKYFKYYKRIGTPGNYRYFYTKEEYDAYANGNQANKSGASAEAKREAENRQRYEDNKSSAIMKKYKDVINKKITEESYNKNKEGDNKNYEVYEGNKPHKDDGTTADAATREAKERQEYEDKKAKEKEWYSQPTYRYSELREKLSPEQNAVVAKLAGLPATVDEYVKSKKSNDAHVNYQATLEYAEKYMEAYEDIMEKVKNPIKHSEMTAEQEYLEFRRKVKAAEKHFSDLRNQEYLEHHGIPGQKWGVRRYQNPDGSLTEEGKQRYLNPDGSISDKAPAKLKQAYSNYLWKKDQEAANSGEAYKDNYYHSDDEIKSIVERAKKTDKYDMSFLEAIQNAESLDDYDYMKQEEKSDAEKEKIAELRLKEYAKYLKNPRKYMSEFDSQKFDKEHKNIGSKPAKEKIVGSEEKKEETNKRDADIKSTTKEQEKSSKSPKDEKKALKEARKETTKLLKGGILGGWAMLNKAMDDLGFTSAERKNLSSSDWEAINKKLKEMRK